jgi:phospholipid transport system substrate-binding protein
MLKRFGILASFLCALVVMTLGAASAQTNDIEAGSGAFVQAMAEDAISSLATENTARDERISRFRQMFNDKFAVRSIGKFVLGRYWRKASDDERKEYMELFEDLMVVTYVDRFAEYAGEALQVKQSRKENEKTVTVFSVIKRTAGAKSIRVNWRIGTNGTIYKVLDVVVEGASMSTTLKSDFASIVRKKGGKVAGLIEELRKKTASLKTQ